MQDLALPRRKFPWAVVVAAVIVAAVAAWFLVPRAPAKAKITTAAADQGDVVVKVTATGTLSALVTVTVGSQVSGRITEILADFNSQVKKGQVIARLDKQLLEAAVTEAKANHQAAIATVDRAKVQAQNAAIQRDRARELGKKNLIAKADLDAAELAAKVADADLETAQANLQQAKSALDRAQVNLGYATIYSPIDGVVISRAVDVGQTVAASLQAPTLFTIAQDLKKMQVDTSVGEADIGKITDGMEATFTVDAYPGEKFVGHVRQIRNAPQTVQNVVTYDVIIDVDNADLKLRPGMTANASFVVATKHDVVRVPNAALRFNAPKSFFAAGAPAHQNGGRTGGGGGGGHHRPEGAPPGTGPAHDERPAGKPDGTRELWVMRGGKPAPVRVHTGLSDGSVTEIVDGDVHAGDQVVTEAVDPGGGPGGGKLPHRMF